VPSKPGHAPAVFDEEFFSEDLQRTSESGAEVALAARRDFERDGIPTDALRLCDPDGVQGAALPHCLKVYLPLPAGRFGMVFQLEVIDNRSRLRYLAFGARHHPPDSNAETVYQIAHRRLHGEPAMSPPNYFITAATVVSHGVLHLTFADGTSGEVDVLERMHGPVFERARTSDGFAEVSLDSEIGTVVWPGDVDLAPDTLYERVRTGAWPQDT